MEEDEKLYQQGFNNGYLLAKHEPDLAAKITAQSNDTSEYFSGLVFGKKQYEADMREWAKNISKDRPPRDDRGLARER